MSLIAVIMKMEKKLDLKICLRNGDTSFGCQSFISNGARWLKDDSQIFT